MKKIKNKKGFSFIEVIVATFIFSLVMIAISMTFSSLFGGYKGAKIIQKNLENAQYAMNLMAKSLRTSSINSDGTLSDIIAYDYSQSKCIHYRFNNSVLELSSKDLSSQLGYEDFTQEQKLSWCFDNNGSGSDFSSMTSGYVAGKFFAIKSATKVVGKVTISMKVCSDSTCKSSAILQSTVSLRDYSETIP